MTGDATGTVVTFYSYKGGVGRTFALANTAAVLARWGYRVLCIDWDLDAPGLVHYLRPWLAAPPTRGVVDLVEDHAAGRSPDAGRYTVPVALPGATAGVDLIPAGAEDGGYATRVQQLDWAALYTDHDLGGFLERCRARWIETYDVVLVDSRTGITDIGGICTAQLPDVLVMLFTANDQSLRGTLDVAERAWAAHDALPSDRGGLQIVPVPGRFDARDEHEQANIWRARFAAELTDLVEPWAAQEISTEKLLGYLTIPYISYWSFGERLPATEETDATPEGISYFLENLAAVVAHGLDRTDLLAESRDSFVAAASRGGRRRGPRADVFLGAGPHERDLAERFARALSDRAVRVFLPSRDVAFRESPSPPVDGALTDAAHLVVVVGPSGVAPQLAREVERFLRQNLDEGAERLVVPVLTPDAHALPPLLVPFRARRLVDDGDAAVAALAATIARDIASGPVIDESGTIRADALDTLADLTAWQLDALRWQLVDQELRDAERAVAAGDDAELRTATAELELLGPVRAIRDGTPMPADLRDRVVTLITRLGGQLDLGTARDAVTARLDRFSEGDPEAVLGDAALAEAARYRLAAGEHDPEAAFLLGLLHHLRSTLRPEDGAADRAAAVRDFAEVFRYAPDQVPPALRDDVAAAAGDVGPEVRDAWASRVTDLVVQGATAPDRTPLDDAVWLAELAVNRAHDAPDQIDHAANLVLALRARFRRWRDPADLDAAAAVAAGHDDRPSGRLATAAGLALVDRYEASGRIADLDAAVARFETAVGAAAAPAGRRSNLASALATRFLARGDLADLDRAVALLRQAVDGTPPGRERAGYQANLGAALATRYGRLGDGRDLDEAVEHGRAAVRDLPDDDPDRVPALSGLGLALRTRYQRTGDAADLDAAVAAQDEALDRAPDGPARAGIASNLSTALRVRADATGERADADRAVALARTAVAESAPGAASHPRYLSNLGAALSARGGSDDVVEAVTVCRQAADHVGAHEPLGATVLANLGLALRRRFAATGDQADLESAVEAYRAAARVTTAAPLPRAIAAQEWGDAATELGAPEDAVTGYATALDLLGQVTDRRLAPPDQQRGLARLGGLGSAAAAAALTAGNPHRALELLEQGRGVLLAQVLDTRGETAPLRRVHPELADRFAVLARRLNDPAWLGRRRLVAEWDDLLDDIRTRPGFERFLLAPTAAELVGAVGDGPLVAVNVAAGRCDALVVAAGRIGVVPLPGLTYDDTHAHAAAFLDAVHGDDPDRDGIVAATLGWLWDTVAAPVCDHLGAVPRVWWMPTGPLAVLPLGCAEGRDALLRRDVVSSTTPSVRALAHARRDRPLHRRRTLVVGAGRPTAGLPALPAAGAEATEVATRFTDDADLLTDAEATTDAVRDALPGHANGHFACHAVVDLADPSRSGLVLTDGTLTVREIQAVDHPDAGLAYLSACSTAFGGATLLDEAVHVAAAFQIAGYRHVIATMWPVGDFAARRFARLVYDALERGAEPAEAVHQAVARTRDALPGRPSVWAAAVHLGP